MPLSHGRLWRAIDALAVRQGLTPSGLARLAGLDATAFNRSKRVGSGDPPRPRWPSTESLNRVLEVTGVSLATFADLAEDAAPARNEIPLLGLAQAGQDGFFDEAGLPTGDGWSQTVLPTDREGLFSLEITGDSMTPLYRPGDRVVVDRLDTRVRKGDRVVARTRDGETLAKEIGGLNRERVRLISINPAYPPRDIALPDMDWIARIQWVSQ